ncbi:MAG: hypothetical protein QOE75_1912 [Solirubrobacterales bacterium]|jgi:hypothetical protein|nr:hypothetical protein [Solirubrobacterales bacterium]
MSALLEVEAVHAESAPFVRAHGVAALAVGARLTIGEARAGGGFGDVHPVTAIDGASPLRPLLAKVFDEAKLAGLGGGGAVVPRITDLHAALQRCSDPTWPDSVLGLPFVVVGARRDGRETVIATLMLDLAERGYVAPPLLDKAQGIKDYRGAEANERLDFAISFARQAALLEELSFLHGDVNLQNLLFEPRRREVQLIDLDAGAVVVRGDEHPLSPGKVGDCMPPEVKGSGSGEAVFDIERYTLGAERWSVGSLIGWLLFGIHPGFFLRAIGARTLSAYAKLGPCWPEVDTEGPLFTEEPLNQAAYRSYRTRFEAAPDAAGELFGRFFAAGLHGSARPTAAEWVRALAAAQEPPAFVSLEVDRDLVVEGEEVVVSWVADNAEFVSSPELGTLPASGSTQIAVGRTATFNFRAVNRYGEDEARTEVVRAVPLPRLETIRLPDPPRLDLVTGVVTPSLPRFSAPVEVPRVSEIVPPVPLPPRAVPLPSTYRELPLAAGGHLPRVPVPLPPDSGPWLDVFLERLDSKIEGGGK